METLKGDEWGSKNLYKTMRLNGLVNQDNVHQQIQKFKFIPENTYIMQLTTTLQNTFILSTSGNIYSWGSQTPELGRITEQNSKPEIIKLQNAIVSIASGSHHVLALDTQGIVYSWGLNTFGQLGKEPKQVNLIDESGSRNKNECWTPEEIPQYCFSGEKVCQIYAGGDSSYAVTQKGLLYVWGDNRNSQLGLIGPYHNEPKLLVHSPWEGARNEIKIVYGKDNAFYTYNMDKVKIFDKMKEDGFDIAQNELQKQQALKQIADLTRKLQEYQQEKVDDKEITVQEKDNKKLLSSLNVQINILNIEITNKDKILIKLKQDMDQVEKELDEIKIQLSNIARREQNLIGKRDVIEQELKKQYRQMVIKDEQQRDLNIENKEKECKRLKELIQANDNIKNTLIKRENENHDHYQKLKLQIQTKQQRLDIRNYRSNLYKELAKNIQRNIKFQILSENKYDLEKLISRYYYFYQQMKESSVNEIAKKSQVLLGIGQILQISNSKLEYIQSEMNGFKPSPNDDIYDLLSKIQEITYDNLKVRQKMNDYIGGLLQQVNEKNEEYIMKFTNDINNQENNLLKTTRKNQRKVTEFIENQKKLMLKIGRQQVGNQNYIQDLKDISQPEYKSRNFCFW